MIKGEIGVDQCGYSDGSEAIISVRDCKKFESRNSTRGTGGERGIQIDDITKTLPRQDRVAISAVVMFFVGVVTSRLRVRVLSDNDDDKK